CLGATGFVSPPIGEALAVGTAKSLRSALYVRDAELGALVASSAPISSRTQPAARLPPARAISIRVRVQIARSGEPVLLHWISASSRRSIAAPSHASGQRRTWARKRSATLK